MRSSTQWLLKRCTHAFRRFQGEFSEQNSQKAPLYDTFKRKHDYLRISLTEKCNLRCQYCMPEEGVELTKKENLLTSSEVINLAERFIKLGVKKIRLTGGEPSIRKDIVDIVKHLNQLKSLGLNTLAMTTNGINLYKLIDDLAYNGLDAVNISLDTLEEQKFMFITRRKGLSKVLNSIDHALKSPINVKLNCVVMRGLNEDEIINFIKLSENTRLDVRFIEYMPFDGNKWSMKKFVPYIEMLDCIKTAFNGKVFKLEDEENPVARSYAIEGFKGRFGFISSMSNHFCGSCNRLRITADGNMKVCLFDNKETSLKNLLRNNCTDEEIDDVIRKTLLKKKFSHGGHNVENLFKGKNRAMIKIGG